LYFGDFVGRHTTSQGVTPAKILSDYLTKTVHKSQISKNKHLKINNMLYHICNAKDWQQSTKEGIYKADSLESEGFIHFSTEFQVLRTANLFYKGQDGLVLLHINPKKLTAEVVYENTMGGEEQFPHLYGALNIEAVEQVLDFISKDSGDFEMPVSER